MVASLYARNYFMNLEEWYKQQKFIFSNWNGDDLVKEDDGTTRGRNLFYVPKNHQDHMINYLMSEALIRSAKKPGEPFIYLGWNRGIVRRLAGTRNHTMHRRLPDGSRQTRTFRYIACTISVFMVTNRGHIAENLEEIYDAVIQPKSEHPVDMASVYILDYPDFKINTIHAHEAVSSSSRVDGVNMHGIGYQVDLIGPALEFDTKEQMMAASSLSVSLYNEEKLFDVITVEN
jgi:hypothetical protein